ncbi:MAG: hypothetical protein KGN79_11500 [Acidobacteriota bacterium]|nr:hypothetical protein [Acidobacteriota bacterium]
MSPFTCNREKEVAALLDLGQWPHASPADLRDHAAACRSCTDLILVRTALQSERTRSSAAPALPTAGSLWWRAQLRKRNQAMETLSRPLLGAQIFAFAIVLIVTAIGFVWDLKSGARILNWLAEIPAALNFSALLPSSTSGFTGLWLLVPILGIAALVSGVVLYFSLERQ